MALAINTERLRNRLSTINRIAPTSDGGVQRLALTNADKIARDMLREWMQEIGLLIRVDDMGNMYGRREGMEALPPVALGSHLDSVPNGGLFDGVLGVVAGLEVMEVLSENNICTAYPLELVNFTNEEGARFEPAMIASGVLAGAFKAEDVYNREDKEGLRFGDELARIGYRGEVESRLRDATAFLELHVEQGPFLETAGCPVGVVEGIHGITWIEVTLDGEAGHAGVLPMRLRKDALAAAARLIETIQSMALEIGDPAVATVGRISASPNTINVIPGRVVLSVDLRHPAMQTLQQMEGSVHDLAKQAADREQVDVQVDTIWRSPPVRFDPRVVETLQSVATRLDLPYMPMTSRAGHDARYIAELAPTAMIFVRSIGGKSHSPDERSEWPDISSAVDLLLHSVLELAQCEDRRAGW